MNIRGQIVKRDGRWIGGVSGETTAWTVRNSWEEVVKDMIYLFATASQLRIKVG